MQKSVASLIIHRLYLSDYSVAHDVDELKSLGITHVISVLEYDPKIPSYIPIQRRLHVRVTDFLNENIQDHFTSTTNFINQALGENDSNKVLVHCAMGVSRSATVVCAYLIAMTGMTASEALAHTQSKRSIARPNPGFRAKLEIWMAAWKKEGSLNESGG